MWRGCFSGGSHQNLKVSWTQSGICIWSCFIDSPNLGITLVCWLEDWVAGRGLLLGIVNCILRVSTVSEAVGHRWI